MHHSKLPLATLVWALSDGDPFQRHLGTCNCNASSLSACTNGLADLRQAKQRNSRVPANRNPFTGLVEVDETEVACRSKHVRCPGGGRCHQGKIIVVGAVGVKDGSPGRIRLAEVPYYSAGSLHPFRTKIAGGPHVPLRLRRPQRNLSTGGET